jgi:hypothetical protein
MFTLEESTLLRRMLHTLMWVVIVLALAAAFLLAEPFNPEA